MKLETQRLESITNALYNLLITTKYELRVGPDHEGSLESPFMREYKYYAHLTESWNDSTTLVLNPYTFEDEVRNNFLIANDDQRTNYIKLLRSKVLWLTEPIAHVEKYLAILEADINSGKINGNTLIDDSYDNYSYVSSFTYSVHMTLVDIEKVIGIIEDNIKIFDSRSDSEPIHTEPTEPSVELQWKGDKTDLAELVWALFKSERITDTSTGKPGTQKELVSQFIALLGVASLDVANLMKTKYGTKSKSTSYKAQDGKTFPAELQTLLSGRVLD